MDSTVATGLTVQQWDDKFFTEYVRENRFKPVMGTTVNSVIQVKQDLTKKKGDSITYALVNKLTNAAVTGSAWRRTVSPLLSRKVPVVEKPTM